MQIMKSSLQVKVLLIILGIFISIGALDLFIKHTVIYPSFTELELHEARANLERCKRAIDREVYHLDQFCHDWSAWTDTYEFTQNRNSEYEESNLLDDTFISNDLNLILIIDENSRVIWAKSLDLKTGKEIRFDALKENVFPQGHYLFQFDRNQELANQGVKGILNTEHGPLLVSSRPVVTSSHQGPPKGAILMGKLLSKKTVESLESQIRVNFKLIHPPTPDPSGDFLSLVSKINESQGYFVEAGESVLTMYTLYRNIDQKPAFIIETEFPRKITEKGYAAVRSSTILMALSSIIVLTIVVFLIRLFILKPISALTQFTVNVKNNRDFGSRVDVDRTDEIGILAEGVNDMMGTIVEQTDLLIKANLKLQKASSTDGLTQIPNRRTFDETYQRDWKRHFREKQSLGLILIDIDYFKRYNDFYGHQQGDICLKQVAETIHYSLRRGGDLAARYGGEEFVVLLPNTDLDGTCMVAEAIRAKIEAKGIEHQASDAAGHVTVSLGAGAVIPGDGMTPHQFIEVVDKALYLSKNQGRNQVSQV